MIMDNDPAGMAIAFCNAINRYSEHTCRVITTQERYGFNFESDIHIPDIEDDDFGEIEQLLTDSDIVHFHMLRDEHSHLGPLVIRDYISGKKILHHHHGHPDFLINKDAFNEKYKKLERQVVVSTPDLLKVARDAVWVPNLVPIHDVQFMPRYELSLTRESIKICQSPTRKFHKHTEVFKSVMAELTKIHPNVETVIIEKTPYFECLRIKKACHIIFDHMRGWFGIASLESLSHGKPVIAGLDDWNIKCIKEFTGAEQLPWQIARNRQELADVLNTLIGDSDLRQSIGQQSRAFMENYWTEKHVLQVLLDTYETL
ncbi:MAG: glycosyltransferase family 1 protein [Desulfobacteraceae bacterium]|nr:MAG: glycosyltransferase family 1 protein [Desulfobacteraceae bacterium]